MHGVFPLTELWLKRGSSGLALYVLYVQMLCMMLKHIYVLVLRESICLDNEGECKYVYV
jgi:hypothetical protein